MALGPNVWFLAPSRTSYLTESRESALMTMARASRTWAAAVVLRSATARSWAVDSRATCSPRLRRVIR